MPKNHSSLERMMCLIEDFARRKEGCNPNEAIYSAFREDRSFCREKLSISIICKDN